VIKKIKAREILDSRGNPTVEVEIESGVGVVTASVPSGASTGKYEALELRDGGKRYHGKGVSKAVKNVNKVIAPKLKGKDPVSQKEIDSILLELDGTERKSKLGANAICPVSIAVCKAGAKKRKIELFEHVREIFKRESQGFNIPFPSFNIINGGVHAGNRLDIQEFMIVSREDSFKDNLRVASEIYHKLGDILSKKFGRQAVNLGDEGGFAPPFSVSTQALNSILEAAKALNYDDKIKIAIDVAASQFFKDGEYRVNSRIFGKEGLKEFYLEMILNYPILSLEDPFSEDDWNSFSDITKEVGKKVIIIGDDLLVTNPKRIKEAEEKKAVNGMILKINQIGTVSESLEAAGLAKDFNWKIMVSHRSGETNDDFIADFSVGIGADFIKSGAPARGERVAKYNRLLRIEEKIK